MKKRQAKGFFDSIKIKKLYRISFPRAERKPYSIIKQMQKEGRGDLWIYEDNGKFLGFATTINGKDAILVDYLAVNTNTRGSGIGSAILQDLRKHYGDDRLFLEIETVTPLATNNDQRERRKAFYLKNGMQEMGVVANIFETDMELLSFGLKITFDEYRNFYRDNYNEYAADHILPEKGTLPEKNQKRKKI